MSSIVVAMDEERAPYSRPRRPRVSAPLDHDAEVNALRHWESEGGHLLVRDSWTSAVPLADRPASTDKGDAR